jgi:hypothetical protein
MTSEAEFVMLAGNDHTGPVLVGDHEVGWWEPFHDPLLDTTVLRLWLDATPLGPSDLHRLADQLVSGVSAGSRRLSGSDPSLSAVEVNRVFPIRGARPGSVLLRFGRRSACGQCRWQQTGCDKWFVEQLVESFTAGCRSLGAEVESRRIRRYVEEELAATDGLEWWSHSVREAGRSGVVISCGHEDVTDGQTYSQCIDVVGRYTSHLSCLAGEVGRAQGAELRGEVTLGSSWPRERTVLRRLHADGWRIRGLTSVFPLGDTPQPPLGIERR